jgi:hypothetical protein
MYGSSATAAMTRPAPNSDNARHDQNAPLPYISQGKARRAFPGGLPARSVNRVPDDFYGPSGIMKQLAKALVERTMEAELTDHLGYEKHHDQGEKTLANSRNVM